MAQILLIEDTDAVRGLFRTILELAGHAVCEAASGSEGIRLLLDRPWDAVITDIYMPNGDGFDVMTAIRGVVRPPKIIAISGESGTGDMLAAAKLLGADVVLRKPVTMGGLLSALEAVLRDTRP